MLVRHVGDGAFQGFHALAVDEGAGASRRAGEQLQLAPSGGVLFHVHALHGDFALLKEALGLAHVGVGFGDVYLDIHVTSSSRSDARRRR